MRKSSKRVACFRARYESKRSFTIPFNIPSTCPSDFNFLCASVRTAIVKNKSFVVFILATALAAAPVFAGGRKKKASPVPKYQTPVISSVTGNSITVTQDKVTRAYTITRFSEVLVNGQKATIADLKPGMAVSVTIGVDSSQASRVVATGAPAGKKK